MSRDPSKSQPLTANVKRLMRLARASPRNANVIKVAKPFSQRDLAYCHKQGSLFMEAASMGFSMEEFAPQYMNSQMAGVFDVSFAAANGMESDGLSNLLRIPLLLKSPETIVEALYWVDDIVSHARIDENKSLLISQAYTAVHQRLPPKLAALPEEPNRNVDELSYAYWLGYIYRFRASFSQPLQQTNLPDISPAALRRLRIQDELWRMTEERGTIIQKAAKLLLSYLEVGREYFSWEDIADESDLTVQQAKNLMSRLKAKRLIRRCDKSVEKSACYTFNLSIWR